MKLTYFNAMGRAELARMILAQAEADYEDNRIEREQWPQLKPTIPTGQVPALEVDGKVICQSMAIARYLAKKFNLTGSDDWEAAYVDMIAECIQDTFNASGNVLHNPHEESKKIMMEKLRTETLPNFFVLMEKFLKSSKGEYLVGAQVTYADIFLAVFLNFVLIMPKFEVEVPSPLLAFKSKVEALPNIKAWIEKRPKTEF